MASHILINPSILRHPIYRNELAMRMLLHLMLTAAEEEVLTNEPRQVGTLTRSMQDLAMSLKWSRSRVVRVLQNLVQADAIRLRKVRGGTEIQCLYYLAQHDAVEPKKEKKDKPKSKSAPIEERLGKFTAICKSLCDADPKRLPEALRKEFHAYWTEPNEKGVLRFEAQPFFDHARRMDTWRRNAESRGFKATDGSTPTTPPGKWNPRG